MSKKVLIVEDEEFLRVLYVQLLKDEGFEVDNAIDGQQAYQKLSQNSYDLVLLDFQLPKMDGAEILDKLKAEFPDKNINSSLVFLSNMDKDFLKTKGITDYKGYIIKSDYTPDQFVAEVKKYLG